MKIRLFLIPVTLAAVIAALGGFFRLARVTYTHVAAAELQSLDAVPVVSAIDPDTAPNDVNTSLVISGTGFSAVLSGTQVITPPGVFLGAQALPEVAWVSSTLLGASLPWGMEPGVYDLTVVNPDGISASLAAAFTVTQGIGVWTTSGPYGGDVGQLVVHPVTPTTVYALGGDVGLFVSDDSGEHWEMALYLPRSQVDMAFDAQDPQVIYSGDEHSLYRTKDAGKTWQGITIQGQGWWKHVPAAHPTLPGVVYAALGSYTYPELEGGIFRSEDYGDTWITLTQAMTDTHFSSLAIHPTQPDTMLAGTESGNIYYSLDSGVTWNWTAYISDTVARLYFNPFEPLQAWATTDGELGVYQALYKSEDLLDWQRVSIDENLTKGSSYGWDVDFTAGAVWATTNGTFLSTDGGDTWEPLAATGECGPGRWLAINPQNPQELYGAPFAEGVCKSEDSGLTWRQSNEGLAAIIPLKTAVSPADADTVYVRAQGLEVAKSESGGHSWRVLDVSLGGSPAIDLALDPFILERVYANNQISADGGDSWQTITVTLPVTWTGWLYELSAIAPHPAVPGRILAGVIAFESHDTRSETDPGLLFSSDDYGEHWTYTGPPQLSRIVNEIAFDAFDPHLAYAATGGSGLWKSSDGGQSWQVAPPPGGRSEIVTVFTHPVIANTVYAFTNKENEGYRLFVSQDAGDTWDILPDGIGGPFYFAPTQPALLYTSFFTNDRIYLSSSADGGYTWEHLQEMQQPIRTLTGSVDGERLVLYLGTVGGFVSPESVQQVSSAVPMEVLPGRGSLLGAGVYRLTTRQEARLLYLPLVRR